jgi:hypothetical protein
VLILFTGRKSVNSILKPLYEWLGVICISIFFIFFSFYNLKYLPLIDFLPYKTGTNIPEKMKRPEGAPADQYLTTFTYEKDGSLKEFTLNNYPANDTSWKFIEQKSILLKKGFEPPIHDFSIVTLQNQDITDLILKDSAYTVLMVSKKLKEANTFNLSEGFKLGQSCLAEGIDYYILTASGSDEVKIFENGLKYCNTDETTLKTMIRSNPGYLLIKDGTIVGKWSWANLSELCILLKNKTNKSIKINK